MMLAAARSDSLDLLRLLARDNPLPSLCAWACPAWCQNACVRSGYDEGLHIQDIIRFTLSLIAPGDASWPDWASHFSRKRSRAPRGTRVAVVGAGASGLAAAWRLAGFGVDVAIYEKSSQPGGRLLALRESQLPAGVLEQDIQSIIACGVELCLDRPIESTSRLAKTYPAVILATGLDRQPRSVKENDQKLNTAGAHILPAGQRRIGRCHPIQSAADGIRAAEEALALLFPGSARVSRSTVIELTKNETPSLRPRNPSQLGKLHPTGRLPSLDEVQAEGARCLDCAILPVLKAPGRHKVDNAVSICPTNALKVVLNNDVASLYLEPQACIRCGICARHKSGKGIYLTALEHHEEFRIVHGI